MNELARHLCDYLLATYGDMAWVTPAVFANGLRIVGELPADATPLHFELFAKRYARVDVNAASPAIAGLNYRDGNQLVITTGRGRSTAERNLTIPHEFGELLRNAMNAELARRELPLIDWEDRAWDAMAAELISPIGTFRAAARKSGLDLIDLADPLSFEAVVQHMKNAFEDQIPLFAIYAKNAGGWERGRGFSSSAWQVAAASWTKLWLRYGYDEGRESLVLPRRKAPLREESIVDRVRRTRRSLLVSTTDHVGGRLVETVALVRPRSYGREVAQVFVIGVEKAHAPILAPQVALVAPDACSARFAEVFGAG